MYLEPLLLPSVVGFLLATALGLGRRPGYAKRVASWGAALGGAAVVACAANIVVLRVAPERFFDHGLTDDTLSALRGALLPRWLGRTCLAGVCAVANLAVRFCVSSGPRMRWVAACAASVLVLLSVDWWLRIVVLQQVKSTARVSYASALLSAHTNVYRRLPTILTAPGEQGPMRDVWGNQLFYAMWGGHFVVISYGSDGKPDSPDYSSRLGVDGVAASCTCGSLATDTIFVDGRPFQSCQP